MSNTQELCRFDRSGVLNGGPKGRQNTKTRNFLRKKLPKLEFSYGGQTAPSEPAPRVGSAGDVLAGLLPSHSNQIRLMHLNPFNEFAETNESVRRIAQFV